MHLTDHDENRKRTATGRRISPSEFRKLWKDWRFNFGGSPLDAAAYLDEVLLAVADETGGPDSYLKSIGGLDGQQEFVLNCLCAMGLLRTDAPPRSATLTELGENVLAALNEGVHLRALL